MYHKAQINTADISLQRTLREVSHSKTFKLFINFLVFESTSNLDKHILFRIGSVINSPQTILSRNSHSGHRNLFHFSMITKNNADLKNKNNVKVPRLSTPYPFNRQYANGCGQDIFHTQNHLTTASINRCFFFIKQI